MIKFKHEALHSMKEQCWIKLMLLSQATENDTLVRNTQIKLAFNAKHLCGRRLVISPLAWEKGKELPLNTNKNL